MEACGRVHLPCTRATEYTFYNLSDIHVGNVACAKKALYKDIKAINDNKFARWFATGDLGEYISARDKRHDFNCVDPEIFDTPKKLGNIGNTLTDWLVEKLDPIKDKCLGIGIGNHEWSYAVANNQENMQRSLCKELKANYLGYTAFVDTIFKRGKVESKAIRHFLCHGSGGAVTTGSKLKKLKDYMSTHEANIYWIGHMHEDLTLPDELVTANRDCTKIDTKLRIAMCSGSYFRTYVQGHTTYGERKGYHPTSLGASVITLKPFHHKRNEDGSDNSRTLARISKEYEL